MALYRYEAVAATGEMVAGEKEAASQDEIVAWLQRLGHIPIKADTARNAPASLAAWIAAFQFSFGSSRRLVLLTQQFATLLHAGLSLDRALDVTRNGVSDRQDREMLKKLIDKIRGGSSLADALTAQTERFPKFYIGMVRAGEAGATLDATLRHLAELLEKSQATREQVKSALIYPAVVLATGFVSLAMIFGFVIPRFRPVFAQAGASLPTSAAAMMGVADFVQNYWSVVLVICLAITFLCARHYRSATGRRRWDARLLRMPLIGDVLTKIEIARFGRTLGTLLKNGVAPISALSITRDTIGNRKIADALEPLTDSLKEGKGLSGPLSESGVVPLLAVQLIRVGEETARVDDMLLKVAEIFDAESKRAVERLLALLVPGITVLLGIVVALVMGSLLKAMMSVYDIAM